MYVNKELPLAYYLLLIMATSSSQTLALQGNSSEQNHFMEKLMVKICSFYDEQSFIDVTFKVSNPTALYTTSDGWKLVNSLVDGRCNAVAVTLNGKIYAIKSVECYNPDTNTWSSCADMTEYHFSGVAAHNVHIYVLSRRGAERYDPQQDTWSQIYSLEVGDGYIACVSLDSKLWAIGGKTNSADKSCVSVLDEENSCWLERYSLPKSEVYNCFVVPEYLQSSM